MQHTYSYLGSPLHLVLEDKIAEGYNRITDAFLNAQKLFREQHGVQWTPDLPLEMEFEQEDMDAYNQIGRIINLLVEINGGGIEITEEMCTSDHLVRV